MKHDELNAKYTGIIKFGAAVILFLLLCCLQWFTLELSATTFKAIKARTFYRSLISISVVLFLNAALLLILGSSLQRSSAPAFSAHSWQ